VKVNGNDDPVASDGEVNGTGALASDTTVCGALSSLVHVTVVPAFTVSVAGLNAKLLIVIVSAGPAGTGIAGEGCAGVCDEEQPAARHARTSTTAHTILNLGGA